MKPIKTHHHFLTILIRYSLMLLTLFFCIQESVLSQVIEGFSMDRLKQHMDSIASDVTEGRFTGSAGFERAAKYAGRVFREAGLEPGITNEMNEKSFFQSVPFIWADYDASSISICKDGEERSFTHSSNHFLILNHGIQNDSASMNSPVFIGYGFNEPELGWDDFSGLDVKNKWVIVLNGIPPANSTNLAFPDTLRKLCSDWHIHDSLKLAALTRHRAAGLIVLPDAFATNNWESALLSNYRFNYLQYANNNLINKTSSDPEVPVILIHPDVAKFLFTDRNFNPVKDSGNYHTYVLNETEMKIDIIREKEHINCCNVIAKVPGIDPVLRNTYITVGAHLDHLGKIGDHTYNGANDDASGCAIILEAARAIAMDPPGRSVLFILYTSEEQHLYGSEYLLEHPPVPIEQISMNINIEQIGSKHRDFPGIWAIGNKQFEEPFYRASDLFDESSLKFSLVEEYEDGLKGSVDLWSYYQKDIPVIMLSSGGFPEHHTIHDNIDLIDLDHLFRSAKFLYSFILEAGNDGKRNN